MTPGVSPNSIHVLAWAPERVPHGTDLMSCWFLRRSAAIIHFLDVGGIPVDDAKGLETMLNDARDKARSDDKLVLAAARVFE